MLQLLAKLRHSIRVSCKVLSEINNQKETASRSSGFQSEETLQPSIHVLEHDVRVARSIISFLIPNKIDLYI